MKTITVGHWTKHKLLKKGAEAEIYFGKYMDNEVVIKKRTVKKYRIASIDQKLRKERTTQEVRILIHANSKGLPVPKILDLNKKDWSIVMGKVDGNQMKECIGKLSETDFFVFGNLIREFHDNNIIHGDLTTSNILVNKIDKSTSFILIDFGLGYISQELEDKAVDLLVFKHTLESSHHNLSENSFKEFLNGYTSKSNSDQIMKRMTQIENRVRYRNNEE